MKYSRKNNISKIINLNLCTSCGACSNICPHNCIETRYSELLGCYQTILNQIKCTECNLCKKVCPIYSWNNKQENILTGNYLKIYSGHSNDIELRKNAASGGLTSAILIYLLENEIIDGALVVKRCEGNPLLTEFVIATSKDDIDACKGSVYSPVSYNNAIQLIKESTCNSIAVVGLPCLIEGLTNICKINKKIANKVKFKFALVCGHTPTTKGYAYSLKKLNLHSKKIISITNRGDGWPGFLKIEDATGTITKIKYGDKLSWGEVFSSCLFTPAGCSHCVDPTGYSADISISDAWLRKFNDDKIGRNLILVRDKLLLFILQKMDMENVIELAEETHKDFIKANKNVFIEKLTINNYRVTSLIKKDPELYVNMKFIHAKSFIGILFINIYILNEKIYTSIDKERRFINNTILFYFKLLKYLAVKWAKSI